MLPTHDEFELLKHRTRCNRIGFIALLKFFSIEGRFPKDRREVPVVAIEYTGHVSEKYIRRYTMLSEQETESALEELFG